MYFSKYILQSYFVLIFIEMLHTTVFILLHPHTWVMIIYVIGWVDRLWRLGWSFVISWVDHLWSVELIICDQLGWSFVISWVDRLWSVDIVNWLHFLDCLKWQIFIVLTFSLPNWILLWDFCLNIFNHWLTDLFENFLPHSLCPLCPLI